jgi:hypothetical protein
VGRRAAYLAAAPSQQAALQPLWAGRVRQGQPPLTAPKMIMKPSNTVIMYSASKLRSPIASIHNETQAYQQKEAVLKFVRT